MTPMASFDSILFPGRHESVIGTDVVQPECFADLHLDQVISAVTDGRGGTDLARYFHVPLRDTATVSYRHEVFGDLERNEIRRAIECFIASMDTVQQRLHQAQRRWHPLQQQGWFVYAVETYCDAVQLLHNTLSGVELCATGLRGFTNHVTHYAGGHSFQALVAETSAVQTELRAQAGMFVAAASLRANVRDGVFTHFKREEDAGMKHGKLDEELARMSEIVDFIGSGSLLLCNESFASTNEREGSQIARDIVRAMTESGVKVVFVTHLHDLAHSRHARRDPADLFLRAERRSDGSRTFRLRPGDPEPTSYGGDSYQRVFGVAAPAAAQHTPPRCTSPS